MVKLHDAALGAGGRELAVQAEPALLELGLGALPLLETRLDLLVGHEQVELLVIDVDLDGVAVMDDGDRAALCRLRGDMADEAAVVRAGEAAVGDERHAGSQLRVGADGLAGVEHLRHTAAAGAFVADEDGVAGLHLAVQDSGDALLLTVVGLGAQGGFKHVLGAGGVLDDAAFRSQIALQDGDAAVGALGVVEAVDDVLAADRAGKTGGLFGQDGVAVLVEAVLFQLLQILAQRLAGDGHHVQMQHGLDLFHHAGHAACIVEALCRPLSCRADIKKILRAAMESVEGVTCDLDSKLMSDRRKVE